MIYSFSNQDDDVRLIDINTKQIIDSLTIEDVKRFLNSLGVTNIIEHNGELICPTICHNRLEEATSMKLYWYQNYKLFHCYTECNENMSIFKLYQKYMELNYQPVTLDEAKQYVKQFLTNVNFVYTERKSRLGYDRDKYLFEKETPELKNYSDSVMSCFVEYYHPSWIREGITKEVMKEFGIKFSLEQNKIIIPHLDKDGNLVGIRGRALEEEDLNEGRKYMPVKVGNILYTHPLHFNLYGLYQNKDAIRRYKKVTLFEGEKSVLKDKCFYGKDSVALAVCGSNLNKYQISLLVKEFGVSEVTLAFDKEYDSIESDEAIKYRDKLISICKKYNHSVKMNYVYDKDNLLNKKDSPNDQGQEIWENLYLHKITIR